jgi:hypothetical protein
MSYPEPRASATTNKQQQQFFLDFLRDMDNHISALQEVGHKRITSSADATSPAPMAVEITLRVGPERNEAGAKARDEAPGETCVTYKYPCGKGPSGYIYCEVKYCESTDPVTTLPG